jgi:glutathione peroxidase
MNFYDLKAKDARGETQDFRQYKGKVVLVVNVASKCGFTPQYEGLEKLYRDLCPRGLVVLGFPCNQFGAQEPGNEEEIQSFCRLTYDTTFPLFAKVDVNGPHAHPVYAFLKKAKPGVLGTKNIKWNFTKFLVNPEGKVVKRFGPAVKPAKLAGKIEALLPR